MATDKIAPAPVSTVEINGQAVVMHFTYLRSIISSSGTLDAEISARSAKASSGFRWLLREVFQKSQISRNTKARIYNATVSSIMLYSSEAQLIAQTPLRRVDAVKAWYLYWVEGFNWYNKICNTDILRIFKLVNLSTQVEANSLRWYGPLLRLPLSTPTRIISNFNLSGNGLERSRERPTTRWADVIKQRLLNRNINPNVAPSLALDMTTWRRLTALSTSSLNVDDTTQQER